MKTMIGWVLMASLALTACEASGAPTTDVEPAPEVTEAPAAATTSTLPLYSYADDRAEASTTTTTTAPPSPAAADTPATITIENFSFEAPSTVGVGDPLVVVNEDGVAHTWTSDDDLFDSGALGSGDTFEYSFEEPGEYSFFCAIHPGMTGTISVTG